MWENMSSITVMVIAMALVIEIVIVIVVYPSGSVQSFRLWSVPTGYSLYLLMESTDRKGMGCEVEGNGVAKQDGMKSRILCGEDHEATNFCPIVMTDNKLNLPSSGPPVAAPGAVVEVPGRPPQHLSPPPGVGVRVMRARGRGGALQAVDGQDQAHHGAECQQADGSPRDLLAAFANG
jgi:hypothetical protein